MFANVPGVELFLVELSSMKFPDRYAPLIFAIIIGFLFFKPMPAMGRAFSLEGLLTFLGGATLGFVAGIPFWIRARRRR
jgi:hypothetical protein